MPLAVTRKISPRFAECQITHIERQPIDIELARLQHENYVQALRSLGCLIVQLPEEESLPDSVFVEDAAIALPETTIIARPGAESRRDEIKSIIRALSSYCPLVQIVEPATVDGGDVLVLGKTIYVGLSSRSNADAVQQMQDLLYEYEYVVRGVDVNGCLHLKSAVTRVDDATLLINKNWIDSSIFKGFNLIDVDPSEPGAANCLPVNGTIIYPASFPKTQSRLEEKGFAVLPIDVSELQKAEGAVTCCSLIVRRMN